MKTAEEVWDEMGDIPMHDGAKLNRIDYDRANLAILLRWQAEILEAAALACEPMTMTEEPGTSTAEECQAAIRKLKEAT